MDRAYLVALYTRRFALIAARPEFLRDDQQARATHALAEAPPGELPLLDAAQMIGSSELDRLCGYAVALLNSPGNFYRPILDLLGVLDPDRICGIYFALDSTRRGRLLRDPVWAFHVQQVEAQMPGATARLEALIRDTPTSKLGYTLARVDLGAIAATGDGRPSSNPGGPIEIVAAMRKWDG